MAEGAIAGSMLGLQEPEPGTVKELPLTWKSCFSKEHSWSTKANLIPAICSFCNLPPPPAHIKQTMKGSSGFKNMGCLQMTSCGLLSRCHVLYSYGILIPTLQSDAVVSKTGSFKSWHGLRWDQLSVFTDEEDHSWSHIRHVHLLGVWRRARLELTTV